MQLNYSCNRKHKEAPMMLLASEYDISKYPRGEDLKQEKKLRIKETTEEVLNNRDTGKPEKKLVVWFTTIKQGLVLNKTNNRTLRGAFGDLVSGWKDKIIVVFPTATGMGLGLRVRIPPPKQAVPQQPAAPQQPATPGNGAAAPAASLAAAAPLAAAAVVATADPELEPDLVKPIDEDLDDEIAF
jgi:hypothetical protein